jgi:hypothetical protein
MLTALLTRLGGLKAAALTGLFLLLLAAVAVQSVRLDMARLKAQVMASKVDALQADIDAQNLGIAIVKGESEKRAKAAVVAAKSAQKALAKAEARASRLEATPTPQNCTEAIEFLVRDAAEGQ